MQDEYKVSIVMPAYNVEAYIQRGIESILAQTYGNIELIIVDDGSTDKTFEIVQQYANLDRRIIAVHQKNSGVSAARNTALKYVSGDGVIFLDSDDWLEHNAIEQFVEIKKDSEQYLIATTMRVVHMNQKGELIYEEFLNKTKEVIVEKSREEVLENFGNEFRLQSACYKLFDLKIIKINSLVFNDKIKHGEDGLFVFEYIKFCKGVAFKNIALWNVLDRIDSATSVPYNRDFLTAIDAIQQMLDYPDNSVKVQMALKHFLIYRIEGLITVASRKRNTYTDIKWLKKRLLEVRDVVDRMSFFSRWKFYCYAYIPTIFLKMPLQLCSKFKHRFLRHHN